MVPIQIKAVAGSQCRFVVELIVRKTVVSGKDVQAVRLRIQTDQSTVGTRPDTVLPIFYRLVGYIVREAVRLRIGTESSCLGAKA